MSTRVITLELEYDSESEYFHLGCKELAIGSGGGTVKQCFNDMSKLIQDKILVNSD